MFDFIAVDFFRNYGRWSPEVVSLAQLTDGPVMVGTLGRQVRVDYGRRTESEFRVVAFDHPRRISFAGTVDPYRLSYDFADLGSRTSLAFHFQLTRIDPHVRPFRGFVRMVVHRSTDRLVESIREIVEREVG